jgi:hypothetical protein
MGESLVFTVPLGTAIGAVCGLLHCHVALPESAEPKELVPRPTPAPGVWDREMDHWPVA